VKLLIMKEEISAQKVIVLFPMAFILATLLMDGI
jgi:hypothetical protein